MAFKLPSLRELFTGKKRSASLTKPAPWMLLESSSGTAVTENSALSISSFYRAISLVGNVLASMPAHIVDIQADGAQKKRPYHPIASLINLEPHPFYTKGDFMMALVTQLMMRQNFVAHIRREGLTGRPINLKIINWSDVYDLVIDNETDSISYKIQGVGLIPGRDILHIKGVSREGILGEDAINRHRDTFGGDLASKQQVHKMYRNGTRLSGFVSTDRDMTLAQQEAYAKSFEQLYGGVENSGATPFFGGGMKYHPISITPAEAQTLETRKYNVYEISRITGVPPQFLFAMDDSDINKLEDLSGLLMRFTIAPLVERIEQEFNRKLFTPREKGRTVVQYDMEYYLRADAESRAKLYETLFKVQAMNPNEIRQREGMNPRVGGDEFGLPFASNVAGSAQGDSEEDDTEETQEANGSE